MRGKLSAKTNKQTNKQTKTSFHLG